ncbi:MAG: hypothetical protein GXO65_03915 [Euryarchaeota archaeon]|nr:hypothetical protein [Euryarchaeota archaeon]
MPLLEWSDKYSLGIREIDEQHRDLIAMINYLHDAQAVLITPFQEGHGWYLSPVY